MWLRISEDIYLPAEGLVGFFDNGAIGREDANEGEAPGRSAALMKDGRVLPMPFTLKSLAARYAKAAQDYGTARTGG